ncbi:hypothetical protein XPA_001702 [Xanthoria parietina]
MTKRRCLAGEIDPPKRKRVAFTTPKAATKAIIERNAKVSPLLKLPSELRDKIWIEVLGGRLIHLDFDEDDDTSDSESLSDSGQLHWKHDGLSTRLSKRTGLTGRRRDHILSAVSAKSTCTLTCSTKTLEPLYDDATLHLTALRASRQLYVEANRVLWTTNTFSFPDGPTFREFMKARNIHQKRLIRALRFEMQWGYGSRERLGTTLRLQIVCDLEKEVWDHNKDRFVRLTTYTEGLRKLSILPLTSVEIAVRPSNSGFSIKHNPSATPGWYRSSELWQKGDRDRCARDLKALLLDPKGAQVYGDFQSSMARTRAELEQLRARTVASKPWLVMP